MTSTEYIKSLEKKVSEVCQADADTLQESCADCLQLEGLLGRPESSTKSTPIEHDPPSASPSEKGSADDVIEMIVDRDDGSRRSSRLSGTVPEAHPSLDPTQAFGGLSLLKRVHKLCKHVSRQKQDGENYLDEDDLSMGFEVAPPESDGSTSWEAFALLPDRPTIDRAIEILASEACCNMQFLDSATLHAAADEVFAELEDDSTPHARQPLALIYSAMALSRLHHPVEPGDKKLRKSPGVSGIRYFRAARAFLDPANCRSVMSLQTLLCMILYTNGTSMMSTCYSYICMAVAASLQLGIFADLGADNDMPEEERSKRRRTFTVLSIADTYVTTSLGLPRTLRDIDPERSLPTTVPPSDVRDPLFGTYMHAELIQILAMTVESNHPFTQPIESKNGTYGVEYRKIVATEVAIPIFEYVRGFVLTCLPQEKLAAWIGRLQELSLPAALVANGENLRSQLMLRLYYAHVQMVLYRPFLHHALRSPKQMGRTSLKAYACGSDCVKAAMQAVWLLERLEASAMFSSALWFIKLIVSFTAAILSLFVTCNYGAPTVDETADAVRRMRELCARHSRESDALKRCLEFLESIPRQGPHSDYDTKASMWNCFSQSTSSFADVFHEPGSERAEDDDMLQALSLPHLMSFVNCRL
ncbi:Gypsy retrotransposon integrase-like protein 1 [Friedmanniomyces endolithicus]|nr:Gypsy retrotransposon integrase-like protein 1 [Friedmanniomyces endolithicus]